MKSMKKTFKKLTSESEKLRMGLTRGLAGPDPPPSAPGWALVGWPHQVPPLRSLAQAMLTPTSGGGGSGHQQEGQ